MHILPTNNSIHITVVKPSNAFPIILYTIDCIPNITANKKKNAPKKVTICIGSTENDVILFSAYLTKDFVDHLDSPSSRSLTSKNNLVLLKPHHDDNALKKVLRSGILFNVSITFLSINLKSDAFFISIFVILLIIL